MMVASSPVVTVRSKTFEHMRRRIDTFHMRRRMPVDTVRSKSFEGKRVPDKTAAFTIAEKSCA